MMPTNAIERLRLAAREYDKWSTEASQLHLNNGDSTDYERATMKMKHRELEIRDLLRQIVQITCSTFRWDAETICEKGVL